MAQGSTKTKESRLIHRKKIVTLQELALYLQCSTRTVQRRLENLQTIRSYNHNGRYYTLEDIPKFDDDGLWRYRGTYFSQFGNLTQTFVQLVHRSPAGLTSRQAGDLLGLRPSSFLWNLHDHPGIKRQKHQSCYVYFSADRQTYSRQKDQRSKLIRESKLPSDMEAVLILAEIIKHPDWDIDRIASGLKKQKYPVTVRMIQNLLNTHGLELKKRGQLFTDQVPDRL
jgi:hypothetical protein